MASTLLVDGCSEKELLSDRRRAVCQWDPPADFSPSYVTADESGVKWGLFVSKRFSGRDNLWAVRSDGQEWENPVCIMNAYTFDELRFAVREGRLMLTIVNIDLGYYRDYGRTAQDDSLAIDTVALSFEIVDLEVDADRDQLPDRIETELLTSNRLPDSDTDGKPDGVDFCPLGKPTPENERIDIYRAALVYIMRLDDTENLDPHIDTSWSAYYGITYLHEPNVTYLSLPGEIVMPEFTELPIVVVEARVPLYFTAKQRYNSESDGIVPHIVFQKPEIVRFGSRASLSIEYVTGRYRREAAVLHLREDRGVWGVEEVTAGQ